jgi:uncharacterized protein YjiS (DUF1127 family)
MMTMFPLTLLSRCINVDAAIFSRLLLYIVWVQYRLEEVKRRIEERRWTMAWTRNIERRLSTNRFSIGDFLTVVGMWRARARSRPHLLRLNEHQLRDIGIDRTTAAREASKPFWRD